MEKVPTDDEDRRLQVWLCLSGRQQVYKLPQSL